MNMISTTATGSPGVAIAKTPIFNFSIKEIFDSVKIHIVFLGTLPYFIGVAETLMLRKYQNNWTEVTSLVMFSRLSQLPKQYLSVV